ncbi:hypothetical protein [Methanoculleus sp. UBA430]|uniref:hypothetical protein n=1 Tax=Methanoculleus sp. UBA430 TaxID=1915511 RepID=UPI0025DB0EDD|nr:hypothetical protein [Methanoculleus sp. UBA430]
MPKQFGLYTTTGEVEGGTLTKESGLALKIGEVNAGFFFRSDRDGITLGASWDVQKSQQRPDTRIYIENIPYEDVGSDLTGAIYRYFTSGATILKDAGYNLLAIWGDEGFAQRISSNPDDLIQYSSRYQQNRSGVELFLAGKLLVGEKAYVKMRRRDLAWAISLMDQAANTLSPVLHLGYCFIVAMTTDKSEDLLILPNFPPQTPVDITIKPEGNYHYEKPQSDIYEDIGSIIRKPKYIRDFNTSATKPNLMEIIARKMIGSGPSCDKRTEYHNFFRTVGYSIALNDRDIIENVLSNRDVRGFEEHFKRSDFDPQNFFATLKEFPSSKWDYFFKRTEELFVRNPDRIGRYFLQFQSLNPDFSEATKRISDALNPKPPQPAATQWTTYSGNYSDHKTEGTGWQLGHLAIIALVAIGVSVIILIALGYVDINPVLTNFGTSEGNDVIKNIDGASLVINHTAKDAMDHAVNISLSRGWLPPGTQNVTNDTIVSNSIFNVSPADIRYNPQALLSISINDTPNTSKMGIARMDSTWNQWRPLGGSINSTSHTIELFINEGGLYAVYQDLSLEAEPGEN